MFVPALCLLGIAIAMIRRSAQATPPYPSEDMATMLLRWATGLLSADRAEWGQAMLGELDHIDGRIRRLRFAFGCVIGALLLPPWGRATVGAQAMITIAVGGACLYASVAVRYRLGNGAWVAAAILVVFLAGFLLAASALLRRPGIAVPGLLGGLFVVLAWLSVSGFTLYQRLAPDITPWHRPVLQIAVPLAVGAAATLYSRDAVAGRRIARLAAVTAGLGLYLYGTLAVAVLGVGGPPDDTGSSVRYIISDRLGTNLIDLVLTALVTATIGWAGAAAAGPAVARMHPAANVIPVPFTTVGPVGEGRRSPMTTPYEIGHAVSVRDWRRTALLFLLCAMVAAAMLLAAASWLRG